MIYTIAFEADKHWGVMRPEDQYRSSYIIKRFLAEFPIDLYVNLGDFFDTKLILNSKASIYAVRDFTDKVDICQSRGIHVRAIKGTRGHDYDQWNIFDPLMKRKGSLFRYFSTCTVEETLPGLNILYAPEENMNYTTYVNTYADMLMGSVINMGFFHGNFDKIIPSIAVKRAEEDKTGTDLIFKYDELAEIIHGPMVAGHWHDGDKHEHLAYVGSYDRWSFGEDSMKGFAIYQYDTETERYRRFKVQNFLAPFFKTYEVITSLYRSPEEYKMLIDAVEATLDGDTSVQVRIYIKINEILPDTEQQVANLRYHFANSKRVHFTVLNQITTIAKKKEREKRALLDSQYSYVRDKNMDVATKLQRFIKQTTGREHALDDIQKLIAPYLNK